MDKMDKYVRLADVEQAVCGWCGVCPPEKADPARCEVNDGLFAALRALYAVELTPQADCISREAVLEHYRVTDPGWTYACCGGICDFVRRLPAAGTPAQAQEPEDGARRPVVVRAITDGNTMAAGAALSLEDVNELATLLARMVDASWRAEAAQEAAVHAAEAAIAAGVEAEAAEKSVQQRTALDMAQDVAVAEWIVCEGADRQHPPTAESVMEALRESPPTLLPLVTSEAEGDGVPEEPEEGELLQAFRAGES